MLWLPAARKREKGRTLSWSEKTDPKGCLHTTETSGWPGYGGWTVHPHATIMPQPGKGVEVEQNVPFNQASFSLRNESGGVQTNTDFVFQFELIGTCERGGPGYYWPGADDAVLLDLYRKVIKPLSNAYSIPLRARDFQAYPASYGARGNTNKVRLSGSDFDNYSGWLGHQHVPENSHGDPGAFPWDRMIQLAEEEDMALSADDKAWIVKAVDAAISRAFSKDQAVRNQPLDPDDVEGGRFTRDSVLSNMEKDLDLIRRDVNKLIGAVGDLAEDDTEPPA